MSQSQRVSKLSRRAGRGARPPPAPVPDPDLPDLDTSDDFITSLSFTRSRTRVTMSQSSSAAEPSSSQSQQLSGVIGDALRAPSVSFCGVLDFGVQQPVTGVQQPATGVQQPADGVTQPRRTRQATRVSTKSSRASRATRQSTFAASSGSTDSLPPGTASEARTSGPPPTIDLSRFARTALTSSAVSKSGQSPSKTSSASTSKAADSTDASPSAPLPPTVSALPSVSAALPAAVTVADCPVCLQPLPSTAARASHLKLCGERRGLSVAQLLAAVRLQQRQAGERAAAGLPATRVAPPPAGRRTRTAQQGRRRGAAAAVAPSAAGDADLQMALAVSASLRDEEERTRRLAESQLLELGLGGEVEAARDRAAAVPPEPAAPAPALPPATDDPPVGRSRGRGGRRKAAPASVLVTQTREERERRLCEKVAQLLAWEEEVPVEGRRLRARKGSPRPSPVWEKAAQLHTSEGDYYVPELVGLVEPCTAPITSLLKDVADIPGRSSLTQKVSGEDPGSGSEAEEAEEAAGATQAALLLLAADSDSQSSQLPGDTNPGPAADTARQMAPSADGAALKAADRDAAGSDAVSRVSETDSVKNRTAQSRRDAVNEGGGDGTAAESPVDSRLSRGVKSSPARMDAGTGCGLVSESPSKAAKISRSPPAGSDINGDAEMTARATMNTAQTSPIPANDPGNVGEKTCLTTPTRGSAEKNSSCQDDSGSTEADGPSSDQAGDSSGLGRDRAERSRVLPVPPEAAASAETAAGGDRVTVDSELPSHAPSPRRIPSTPDSGASCSPAAPGSTAGSSPMFPASPGLSRTGDAAAGRRSAPTSPTSAASQVCSDGGACFAAAAHPGDLGAALLDLLLTGGGPPAALLLCSDGMVMVHAAVLAVRCPPLYRAVTGAGGRLLLPEVGHRAAAALVRLLYLGETDCAAGGAPLPQLLLLAEKFGLEALAGHLRRQHGVTEPATGPARPPSPSPLSPELFDLTASDGAEEMELGSPAVDAAPGPGSGCDQSPRRGSDSVVCSPGQSPERGEDEMDLRSPCGPTASPVQAGETSRRDEKTATKGDRAPPRDRRTPSPAGETFAGADEATDAAPSTPRRGQKRPGVTPRRPGSSDDICEVFSSLPKRRRTASVAGASLAGRSERPASPAGRTERPASPAGRTERPASPAGRAERSASPAGRTERPASPAGRTERPASPASQELRSASPATRERRAASPALQEIRPASADSDVQILDEVPVVFTQRLKSPRRSAARAEVSPRRPVTRAEVSPRRSSARTEGAKPPVTASEGTPGGSVQDNRSGASPTKTPSQVAGSRERSPVVDVSLLSSPSLSQTQPRRRLSERGSDSFASSPLISRRQEQTSNAQEQLSTLSAKHRKSGANEVDSPVSSQRLAAAPSDRVADGNGSPAYPSPYSPEVPIMSPLRSPEVTFRVSPLSSQTRRRSASPLLSPGTRPGSPPGSPSQGRSPAPDDASSPSADLLLDDVWDGFEDGGYIELLEAPPASTPLRPAAGSSSTPAGPPAGPRSSLDSSELWQDSSLLAGFTTPTAAEPPPDTRQTDVGTPRVRSSDAGTFRARPKDAGTPGIEPEDAGTPGVRPEDSGTPDAGMAAPQRTPVNRYRVVLRDSNTPMPNYVLMLTPELKRELTRIGVKPIARRKAVALLSHIYEETHPPASTAVSSSSASSRSVPSASSTAAPRAASSASGSAATRSVPSAKTTAASGSVPSGSSSSAARSAPSSGSRSSASRPPSSSGSSASRPPSSNGSSAARPPSSSGSSASRSAPSGSRPDGEERFARPREPAPAPAREPRSCSSDSESSGSEGAAARLEEVFGRLGERLDQQEEEEEEEITPSQAACAATLPEVLRSYILSRPELYHQVLTYEPVWLESLYRDLRQTGVKLNVSQLMDFLDEQCITFRTENSGRRRKSPKKKKSPKKTSPKKRGPSQKKKSPRKKVD